MPEPQWPVICCLSFPDSGQISGSCEDGEICQNSRIGGGEVGNSQTCAKHKNDGMIRPSANDSVLFSRLDFYGI